MATTEDVPERMPRGDRVAILSVLAVLILAGWAWLFYQDRAMRHMDVAAMAMPSMHAWGAIDLALVFLMWAVMMAAMMLPSAVPMVLLYAKLSSARNHGARALPCDWAFLLGYLAVWTGFSLLATLLQWGLHASALSSPMMVATPVVGGLLLLGAGVYQWSRFKQACLAQCRAPLGFLLNRWRNGASGAFSMGVMHGAYCVGCCWMLMLLMFVLGMMNLLWVAALSLIVLLEKMAPRGAHLARAGGAAFLLWGGLLLLKAGS